jgi:hypothetical protein
MDGYPANHHQRHAEIEVSAQERLELVRRARFFLNTGTEACTPSGQRSLSWRLTNAGRSARVSWRIVRCDPSRANLVWEGFRSQ